METSMNRFLVAFISASWAAAVAAQTFVEGTPPSSAELKSLLTDKVFTVALADGSSWRLDFKSNGYYFVDTSTGFSDSGTWRTEDGKLCVAPRKTAAACNESRLVKGELQFKRLSGEVITYKLKQ
jgi:hypothetical protein